MERNSSYLMEERSRRKSKADEDEDFLLEDENHDSPSSKSQERNRCFKCKKVERIILLLSFVVSGILEYPYLFIDYGLFGGGEPVWVQTSFLLQSMFH